MAYYRKNTVFFLSALICAATPLAALAYYEVSGCGGCGADYFYECADRFVDEVKTYPGWTSHFVKGCSTCKEKYYKSSTYSGEENSWVDSSDIHFHNSHCTTAWDSYYGKTLSAVPFTDGTLVPSEARLAWGDNDLEWIAFKCCSLLRDSSRGYWAGTMDGLHLLLGYKTSSYGYTDFGKIWAQKMKTYTIKILWLTFTIPGQTVTQAWFNTTDETQPSGTVARVLAETYNCYNDHLHGMGYVSPDPTHNNIYWYWDHTAGSPPYRFVNNLQTMYRYEVLQPKVDETYVKNIATAFNLQDQKLVDLRDMYLMTEYRDPRDPNSARILQVFKDTGQYYYHDLNKLWSFNPRLKRYPSNLAYERSNEFLTQYQLKPSDVDAHSVEYDTVVEAESGEPNTLLNTYLINTCTVFSRSAPAAPERMVTVAGPGARMKVYMHEDGGIMGGMGNWRRTRQLSSVEVISAEQAWTLFLKYGQKMSLAPVQAQFDRVETDLRKATQAYYEAPGAKFQTELIPCWVFIADYYHGKQLVVTAETYVPAAEGYSPPVCNITSPADNSVFPVGTSIQFDCSLAKGFGTPPFVYLWESDIDGILSYDSSFTTNSLSLNCPDVSCDCSPIPHVITLTVTDSKGLESTDNIQVTVDGPCSECINCADLNRDGDVNGRDFAIFGDFWLTQTGGGD